MKGKGVGKMIVVCFMIFWGGNKDRTPSKNEMKGEREYTVVYIGCVLYMGYFCKK